MDYVVIFMATALAFLLLDAIWLSVVAKSFYLSRLKPLILDQPNFKAAALFYVIYIFGIIFFVIEPARVSGSWVSSSTVGLLFGFITYSTYDLTNLATLRNWPMSVALVDILWGACLTSASATLGFFASLYFL